MSDYPMFDGGESHLVTKTTVTTNLTQSHGTAAGTGAAHTDAGAAPGFANTDTIARAPEAAPKAAPDTPDPPVGGIMTAGKS
jgi:hypothetical protein